MRGKKEPGRRGAKPGKAKVNIDPAGRRLSPTSAARGRQLEQRLAEALEQQAATSEILRVVSSSPHDVQPVFDAIVRSSVRLCGGLISCVFRYDGERLHFVGHHNFPPAALDIYQRTYPLTLDRDRLLGRAILERRPVNVADVFAEFRSHIGQRELGNRSILAVPMLHEGAAIGVIAVSRAVPGLFPEHQVALVQTFADQAVIAIENVRLFRELGARNGELTEALSQQTATGEVLRVISNSPTDAQPVFETIVRNAARLCDAEFSAVSRYEGGLLHMGSINNMTPEEMEVFHRLFPRPAERGFVMGRAFVDGRTVHIEDVLEDPEYDRRTQGPLLRVAKFRTFLGVPILRDGKPIGVIGCARREVRPFTATQIELVKTFAEQAVIAIENVRLFKELEARNRDLTEALDQQTATGEILRVISQSQTDVQPVFDAIVRSAARLCDGLFSALFRYDGEFIHQVAQHNFSPEALEEVRRVYPARPRRAHGSARAILERAVVHIPDVARDADYLHQELTRAVGFRSGLFVPMLRDGESIGVIMVARAEPGPFTDSEIELLKTFADQAVIAVENVRLFTELEVRNRDLTETLEQQTATSEILRVISSSPTDVQPVFDTIASNARRLCNADSGSVFTYDGTMVRLVSLDNTSPERSEALRRVYPLVPTLETVGGRAILTRQPVHISDVRDDPTYVLPSLQDAGLRSVLSVPMLRDGLPVGIIIVHTWETPRPFTRTQIDLLKTFADQAVIAIENVRLFKELDARNRDLTETLEQQTATGEILRVISSSPTDVQPVFDTIAESARRLCEAEFCQVFRLDDGRLHFVASHGHSPEGLAATRRAFPTAADRGTAAGRAILSAAVAQVPDVDADPEFALGAVARAVTFRSLVAVPMMREGTPIGAIAVARSEPGLFPDRQVALLATFADQAVIAVENVRLFTELEARNRDLVETLEQQTATSEILRVISRSQTDVQPVFDTIVANAVNLCGARMGAVYRLEGELLHLVTHHNYPPAALEILQKMYPRPPQLDQASGRAILTRSVAQIEDMLADPLYPREITLAGGWRSILSVPMLRDGEPIGAIVITRSEVGPFSVGNIELLRTFADQAVIAIENVRLFKELDARNRDLLETLEQQTATSEILSVISSSPTDVQPVFDTVVVSAARLCDAFDVSIFRLDTDRLRLVAHHGPISAGPVGEFSVAVVRGTVGGRSVIDGRPLQVADLQAEEDEFPEGVQNARRFGFRTILSVPLLREGVGVGCIQLRRAEAQLFTERQVALLQTFADQAVIATENVRLFQELEARTEDLTRSVGELRALGEVSQAVSSTLDLETVLATIVSHAVQLSGSHGGVVYEFDEVTQSFHARATHQITPEHLEALRAAPIRLGEGAVGRAGVVREPVQIADIQDERELVAPQAREHLIRQGMRALLAMPLIRDDRLLGGIVITRREVGAFSPGVVATLQTFAAQSVLAFQNARLFRESQRQKQYSEMLVETSPVAIATMDLHGAVVGWNPGAERLFGFPQAEALGHQMEDLVGTPELREEVRANIRQTLEGEWIRAITRRARKNGTLVDVEISSMPVIVDGAKVGMIAIYHDITELLQARREAEAANEAKSAFLATMSHEIRTPMNAVIGMSGLLLNTALTDEQREYAEIVRQSGDTLLTVINDILDFSKIEAGRLELESQPFDVRECIESALDLVATRAAEKGIDLAYLIGDGTPAAVGGDVTRLRQVLLNLLSNAVKFTEAGEVVLSVSARRRDGGAPLHDLTFSVRDTGIGIPPDRLDRLFQSFSQVDASTTRRYGGTGLGLAISQRLTELMGGRISVTSQVGAGSEFRFTIRVPETESPLPARRDLSGVQPSLRGKRVLVVDDNATNRRILAAHFDAWGMRARATESPLEALAWIRGGERFDVGILDMHMPEMDGVTLAQAIREHLAGAPLPLILFTSLGRREARAEEVGFAAYLNKPIKPSQLFDALVSVLAEQAVHVPQRRAARSELDPEMAARHPLRILLAEDNVVNQKVALRILGQMGYRADVAANGLEAIEAVERQTYDVVLMDVQMPELDGFEASREINRRWPGERRPRLVAMTANAMEGDRELCVAAGMDDYVAKPIRVEELVAALGRCRPRGDGSARRPSDDGGGAPAAAGAIDRAVFERLTATMDAPFVAELIDTFTEDTRGLIETLRRSLAAADRDAFRRAAHSLKSTSESLGATDLANLARELETIGRSGVLSDVGDRIERLAAQYELVTLALGALRHGLTR